MDPIADRIAAEEGRAQIARARAEARREADARAQPRYVALERAAHGTELTIRGVADRPAFGWSGVIVGLTVIGYGAWWLAGSASVAIAIMVVGLAVVVASLSFVLWPRSTLRVLATPAGFAVFTRAGHEPAYVGRHDSLSVKRYEWRGRTGVSLRVWNARYWAATYMDIAHPDDFAAIEAFDRLRGSG